MIETKIKRNAIKIAMLGDSRVGKTRICQTFMNVEFFENTLSTIGLEKLETQIKLRNGEEIKLILWDTAGQERFHSIALNTIRTSQGVVVVFSYENKESFDNITNWLDEVKENLNNASVVLFGNKCDLPKEEWKVTKEQAKKFAEEINLPFFETSAKDNIGIKEGFEEVVNAAYQKFEKIPDKGIKLEKEIEKHQKSGCCGGENSDKGKEKNK